MMSNDTLIQNRLNESGWVRLWEEINKGNVVPVLGQEHIGDFVDGKRNGYGTYYSSKGIIMEGTWKDSSLDGEGKYRLPSGCFYVGDFELGDFNGLGTKYDADGTILETGIYSNDQFVGYILFTVDRVAKHSPVAEKGIQRGDIILTWGDFHFFEDEEQLHPIGQLPAGWGNIRQKPGKAEKTSCWPAKAIPPMFIFLMLSRWERLVFPQHQPLSTGKPSAVYIRPISNKQTN